MCGRVKQKAKREDIESLILGLHLKEDLNRPNIKPTQAVDIVINEDGQLKTVSARWWAQYPGSREFKTKYATFNARVDRLGSSKLWKTLVDRKRYCLLPVTSFYEWNVKGEPPMEIFLPNQPHYGLAGLWSKYFEDDEEAYSFTVFTTEPNEFMKPIHPKAMPVILDSFQKQRQWLIKGDEAVLIPYENEMEATKLDKKLL